MTYMKIAYYLAFLLVAVSCRCIDTDSSCGRTVPLVSYEVSNQKIHAFGEDTLGHIWIGTFRGLNKFTGHEYYQYFCDDQDSTSLPDNQVNDILCDSRGTLWIASVNGLCQHTELDRFRRLRISGVNANVSQLLEDSRGRVFAFAYPCLQMYDPDSSAFRVVIPDVDMFRTYASHVMIGEEDYIYVSDSRQIKCYNPDNFHLEWAQDLEGWPMVFAYEPGYVWMSSSISLGRFNVRTRSFEPLPAALTSRNDFSPASIVKIYPYSDGIVFCMAPGGMFFYSYSDGTLVRESEPGFPFDSPAVRVNAIFTDSRRNLWIGSVDQGVSTIYHYKDRFNEDNALRSELSGKSVTALAVDHDANMWISTLMDGMYVYSQETMALTHFDWVRQDYKRWNRDMCVNSMLVDSHGDIWQVGTDSSVRKVRLENGRQVIDGSWSVFLAMSIAESQDGTIWVGTASKFLYYMRPGETGFTQLKAFDGFTFIPGLVPYGEDQLLVCAFARRPLLIDVRTLAMSELPVLEEDWSRSIARSEFIPTAVYQDAGGDVWIGTVANGLLCYDKQGRLRPVKGAACTDISSIQDDMHGYLWIGTQSGLSKFCKADSTFTNYYSTDGIGGNQFYDRSSCILPDGKLAFGGTHGLTYFSPTGMVYNNGIPLVFEELKVHNRPVSPEDGGCISGDLSLRPDINLKYCQNGFSISYAALDYSEYERVRFHYMLEGFDRYWIDAGSSREAWYANLPAGRYTFKVRITSNDSDIAGQENSINVIVHPAPWASWWAWLLYVCVAGGLACYLVTMRLRMRKERMAAEKAERDKEHERLVNQMNMNFFANVSHEFRTPLTLISGPVAQLSESSELKGDAHDLLMIVRRSVDRMLKLVNQLMDFNKLEDDTLYLQVKTADVVTALRQNLEVFSPNIKSKGISLRVTGLEDSFISLLDEDKLEKIFGNLLSNALKFTPEGGRIEVCFDVVGASEASALFPEAHLEWTRYMKVSVMNSGADIPESEREKIFSRYYQIRDAKGSTYNNMGTGIGLYYARRLAQLHHGLITCGGTREGHGAVFTFILPVDEAAYDGDARFNMETSQRKAFPLPDVAGQEAYPAPEKKTVLVVDDDTEIALYLKTLLLPHYNVVCRFDVDNAIATMKESAPDCILCDVVMPGKDGFELCREVREDLQLCHIPLILVTANVAMENQVKGLNIGANAYVTKPFDPEYLLAMIGSQLQNQDNVRRILSASTQTSGIEGDVLSPQDNQFMTELYRLIESELSNPELNVVAIAERMHMSRTKFYYKVKGLTGDNPSVFFKTYKLNRAAEMISEGRYTISEISDLTGFSTLSVFSKLFKKQFGVAPSSFRA